MASIMQILRRIGGAKATPTSGSAGQLALWKAGTAPTDAASLYAHDGTQWVELLDTSRNPRVITANDAVAGLRITQTGAGEALRVEDEANPDASPFVVDADGRVGVGVAAPNAKMQIDVASYPANPLVTITNGATHGVQINPGSTAAPKGYIGSYTNNAMGVGANNLEAITILPNSAVGISNQNPQDTLDVGGNVTVKGNVSIKGEALYHPVFNAAAYTANSESAGYLSFMRGRGTFAAPTSAIASDVLGTVSFAAWDGSAPKNVAAISSRLEQAIAGGFAPGNLTFSITKSTGTLEMLRFDSYSNFISMPMYTNAVTGSAVNVASNGLVGRASSSLKYKKDVETLDPAIADNAVKNLRPVWYRAKEPKGDVLENWSHIGLIAEEVDKVEKRLVNYRTVEVTTSEDGERVVTPLETPVPEDVDYARLSVLLLDYIQRLEKRVAALEARP